MIKKFVLLSMFTASFSVVAMEGEKLTPLHVIFTEPLLSALRDNKTRGVVFYFPQNDIQRNGIQYEVKVAGGRVVSITVHNCTVPNSKVLLPNLIDESNRRFEEYKEHIRQEARLLGEN
jgi:hypothetical protein